VVEASAARAAGLAVAALSLITNPATGLGLARLAHDEVLAAGRAATERLQRLLRSAVPALAP